MVAAILCGIAVVIARRGGRATFEAIVAFLRLYWYLSSIRLSRFTRSRKDYKGRPGGESISGYVATARSSLKMIGFSLMTGIQYEELTKTILSMVQREKPVMVDISLLDPRRNELAIAIAPSYTQTPDAFMHCVYTSIDNLFEIKGRLPEAVRSRLRIRVHRAIPFGSAILIDADDDERGRIQIETKGYRSGLEFSWGFELRAGGRHGLYKTLQTAYEDLLSDGEELLAPLPY